MSTTQLTWLQEEERLLDLITNNTFIRIPLASLAVSVYYIDRNNEIVDVFKTRIEVDGNKTTIEWDLVYTIIRAAAIWNGKTYAFDDAALHHISIDYHSIDVFSPECSLTRVLSHKPIKLDSTLAVFHDLSELFVFMREDVVRPKSILKTDMGVKDGSKTKKVRINEEPPDVRIINDRRNRSTRRVSKRTLRKE